MTSPPVAWLDLAAGISGDMFLGALIDAGADLAAVRAAVDAVLPATVELTARERVVGTLRAVYLDVALRAPDQPHRAWAEIRAMLERADLEEGVRTRSQDVFAALAAAEARVHGVEPDAVHFHEVGGWDSIADIVGGCAAYLSLGIERLTAGPVELGSGVVTTAHGRLPVPGPAVAELLAGWPVTSVREGECATPTGAALVRVLATPAVRMPPMVLSRTGIGSGTRETTDRPNVVRLFVGTSAAETAASESASAATITLIETNVDDLDPRLWPGLIDAALAAGAADAWLVPIVMKKGRPAHTFTVLAPTSLAGVLTDLVLTQTSTLGARVSQVRRPRLDRASVTVEVETHPVRVKAGLRGTTIVHATPEFADVEAAAERLGRPVADVLDAARSAARAARLVPGQPLPEGALSEETLPGSAEPG